jgi:hypothetical protein
MENILAANVRLIPPKKHRILISAFFLVIAVFITYWQILLNQFQLSWDDWWVVQNGYTEGGLNVDNLGRIFTEFYHGQYAPLNELFYLLLYHLFGYNPLCFHLASLLIHTSCVLLVFRLVLRVLRAGRDFDETSAWRIALITSLLMAIHPFLVEAVAWMSASKCLIWAFFYLLALHTYVSYILTAKGKYYLFTLLFFCLSFGGKEQAVTLPACLLLFDFILKRKLDTLEVWLEKIPFAILAIGFVIITFVSQKVNGEGLLTGQVPYTWYQNVVFSSYTITEYFLKCLLPLHLSYIYPFPNLPGEPTPFYFWLYPVLLICLTIGFWNTLKRPWIAFGLLFFLIQVSVFSNIVPMSRFAIIADRYVYLAAVGPFFVIAYLINQLLQQNKKKYRSSIIAFSLYALCLASYAKDRSKVWYDSNTLKQEIIQALKSRPDYSQWKKKLDLPD